MARQVQAVAFEDDLATCAKIEERVRHDDVIEDMPRYPAPAKP
jgi:hypothetical protein